MSIKILLDTDIGTDIDDAICLAYLLANPECDLLGITTVTGESEKRAMMASVQCKIAGKDIPIFPGADSPLIIPQLQTKAQQAKALAKWDHNNKFPKGEAIEFLRQTIRKYPGEIILLTIAPLTNIGLLFAVDPEIPSLLKGLVSMCGYFEHKLPNQSPIEWNAMGDYHASKIVYNSKIRMHRSIGLDVTGQVTMASKKFKEKFNHELLKPVLDFADVWFEIYDKVTFHDPLAATTIFNNKICNFKKGKVDIEIKKTNFEGFTTWEPGESAGAHEIASEVNKELFFSEYFSVFE
ncbi:MAG: nucleoside hydrolase [Ignavibacteriaceae bacterium]